MVKATGATSTAESGDAKNAVTANRWTSEGDVNERFSRTSHLPHKFERRSRETAITFVRLVRYAVCTRGITPAVIKWVSKRSGAVGSENTRVNSEQKYVSRART